MIASLSGLVLAKSPNAVILDVGGVGYEAFISGRTYDALPETGHACFLFVQTVVREDAIILFGFSKKDEKDLFLLLVTVSGIGPKLALTILSGIGVEELCRALTMKDVSRLMALPGIGKKTAQRLCVELAEKVGGLSDFMAEGAGMHASAPIGEPNAIADAVSALVNLGYPQAMAWQALRVVEQQLPEGSESLRVEDLIRLALRSLAAR
ncbi:Holliday junction branch migration protein RuvA [uncultured Desulfobulbus sp.]|uniref:Holliday junction branch migration protein RuvA n=1 Tax=uncultured Desulfobulbus sp. TaxID=239745 RepID=UPI0029C9563E|nr:Holliday junction branch migration protein RuvA [uncultured Desulfobulbus sp.]